MFKSILTSDQVTQPSRIDPATSQRLNWLFWKQYLSETGKRCCFWWDKLSVFFFLTHCCLSPPCSIFNFDMLFQKFWHVPISISAFKSYICCHSKTTTYKYRYVINILLTLQYFLEIFFNNVYQNAGMRK
jgi:hypothetical protein